jgi:hypothetical protein
MGSKMLRGRLFPCGFDHTRLGHFLFHAGESSFAVIFLTFLLRHRSTESNHDGLRKQVYRPAAVRLDSAGTILCRFIE